ncbi:AGAP005514-PA-like protein [Anopheles sinensis]|uniref:AGAP005514-PA-like protein n=1 Tax=Anopheles sinensis TaxID=74873 RepID=A0A084VZA0_ANOSI|nr:AGAP005514-PA-like protein [Anopheles sinensis]
MSNENANNNDSTFCQIMKPIFFVSKVSGLWPQSLQRSSPGITVLDIAYLAVLYAMFIFCILVNTNGKLWDYYMQPFGSDILRYGLQTHIVNGLYLGLVMITINIVQYKRKWEYTTLLDSITKIVEKEFYVKNPVRVVQTFIWWVVIAENVYLLLILFGYYCIIDRTLNIKTSYFYASYYLINLTTLALINEYTYFTFHIRRLFSVVNRLMKQLLLEESNSETILLDQNRKSRTPTIAYDEIFTIYGKPTKQRGSEVTRDIKRTGLPKITMVAPASAGFNKLSMDTVYNT